MKHTTRQESSGSRSRDEPGWTVGWGASTRCDLNCAFCYSSQVRREIEHAEVDLGQAEQFLANNGSQIRSINFGTGECLLSPIFSRLLELCQRYAPQAQVAITTNGALAEVSADTRAVVQQYLHECDISLDFARADEHDRWRGKQGIWQRAIRAIEMSRDLDVSIVMIGTAQTLTQENIQGLLKIAEAYHIAIRVNLYMPTFSDASFLPSREAVFRLIAMLNDWGSALRSSDRLLGNLMGTSTIGPHLHARRSCRLLPDGSVSPSTYLLAAPWLIPGRLESLALENLLDTEPFQRYSVPPLPEQCKDCPLCQTCQGGSVERRWLWQHSLEMPDPLCPWKERDLQTDFSLGSLPHTDDFWQGPTIHLDYLPTIISLPPSYRQRP